MAGEDFFASNLEKSEKSFIYDDRLKKIAKEHRRKKR
jgi:hypothetical protein